MLISRLHTVPRFGLPYTPLDFAAALKAIFGRATPPDAFGLLGDSPKFWTRSGRQALRLLLSALEPQAGIGCRPPFVYGPLARQCHRRCRPSAGFHRRRSQIPDDGSKVAGSRARKLFRAGGRAPVRTDGGYARTRYSRPETCPVIEDAAHAPLSYLNDRMAGSFGLASFYSFASTKYWPAGGGGLAVVNDATLARKLARATEALSAAVANRGTAQSCSSGGKGLALHQAALRNLWKTNAPMGGEVGHPGAQSGSESDPAFVCRSGVPASLTVSQKEWSSSEQTACDCLSHLDLIGGRCASARTTGSTIQLSSVSRSAARSAGNGRP